MRKNTHKGFTLTEIVIAILIISGTILSIVSVFTYGANYSLQIKNQAEGEKVLTLMAEEIQKNPYKVNKGWNGSPSFPYNNVFPFGNANGEIQNVLEINKKYPNFNLQERYDYKVIVKYPPTGMINPVFIPPPPLGITNQILIQKVDLTVKGPLEENGNDKYKGGTKLTKEYDMKFYVPILIQ